MLLYEVFVRKRARAIDSRAARPITMEKVTALDHEVLDLERMSLVVCCGAGSPGSVGGGMKLTTR